MKNKYILTAFLQPNKMLSQVCLIFACIAFGFVANAQSAYTVSGFGSTCGVNLDNTYTELQTGVWSNTSNGTDIKKVNGTWQIYNMYANPIEIYATAEGTSAFPPSIFTTTVDDCSPGGQSIIVTAVITSAPWTESFTGTTTPSGWSETGEGYIYNTEAAYGALSAGDYTTGGGTNYAWIDGTAPNSTSGTGDILTSPEIDLSDLTTPHLCYALFSHNTNDSGNNTINVEFYDGAAWNTVTSYQQNLGPRWVSTTVNLASYTITGNARVRFTIFTNSLENANFNDILIDDVSFNNGGCPSTCIAPSALEASNITPTSADLAWTNFGTATQWEVEYGTTGFTPGNGTTITTTDNPFNITSLTQGTTYDFYVRAVCDVMDASIWDGPNSFTTISINNDLAIVDTNVGQDQYTSIPLTQISSIANGRTIENVGTVEATNVILTVAVADSNSSEVYTESSSPQVIAVGASLPITFTGFTPTMLGSYTVTYTLTLAETDTDLSNNTTSSTKEISLGTYARDNNIATGSLGIGTGNGGQLGQQFDILVTQDIVSVTFEIANQNAELDGTTTFVTIWDMVSDVPNAIVAQTEVVTINGVSQSYTANIIGSTFSLETGKYLIAIEEGTSNINLATTEEIFTAGTNWVNWPALGYWAHSEDFGFNVSYLLRPNLQDPTLSIKDNEISNNLISIFPNPANSTINVSGLTTKHNYTIYNILGAKISTGEISNTNNRININDFANGIYLLKFNNGNTLKFVKE